MWAVYSILSAATEAMSNLMYGRRKDVHPVISNIGVLMMLLPVALIVASKIHFSDVTPSVIGLSVLLVSLGVACSIARIICIQKEGLGATIPLLNLTPLFTIVSSWILLKEGVTPAGIAGVILIVAGAYVLNLSQSRSGLHKPVLALFANRYSLIMIAIALAYAVTSPLSKMVILQAGVMMYLLLIVMLNTIISATIGIFMFRKEIVSKLDIRRNWRFYLMLAALAVASEGLFALALQSAFVTYTISLKRISILFSVILGFHFLKEKRFKENMLGTAVMLAGVMMITILG